MCCVFLSVFELQQNKMYNIYVIYLPLFLFLHFMLFGKLQEDNMDLLV